MPQGLAATRFDALLQLLDEWIGRALEQRHQLPAVRLRRAGPARPWRPRPVVDRRAGDRQHVVAGLPRQRARARRSSRARAAGRHCRRRPPSPRLPNLSRSSRRNSADFGSACTGSNGSSSRRSAAVPGMNCAMPCAREPLRVIGPDRVGLEAALLPDHAGEEFERQAVRPRGEFDHQAHRLARIGRAGRRLLVRYGRRRLFGRCGGLLRLGRGCGRLIRGSGGLLRRRCGRWGCRLGRRWRGAVGHGRWRLSRGARNAPRPQRKGDEKTAIRTHEGPAGHATRQCIAADCEAGKAGVRGVSDRAVRPLRSALRSARPACRP